MCLSVSVQFGDSDSDSMWDMSSESSSSSSEEEGERGTFHYTAEYFLKKLVIVNCKCYGVH